VVVGTAAPVIALSALVSWNQFGRRLRQLVLGRSSSAWSPGRVPVYSAGSLLGLTFVLQALAFLISLRSLSTGRDASSLDATTFLTFGGFLVMFLATGITILITPRIVPSDARGGLRRVRRLAGS